MAGPPHPGPPPAPRGVGNALRACPPDTAPPPATIGKNHTPYRRNRPATHARSCGRKPTSQNAAKYTTAPSTTAATSMA